jgi:hypothetical protein
MLLSFTCFDLAKFMTAGDLSMMHAHCCRLWQGQNFKKTDESVSEYSILRVDELYTAKASRLHTASKLLWEAWGKAQRSGCI